MPGMFDDLIPASSASAAPAEQPAGAGGGMFDDLIPKESNLDYAEGVAQKAAQGATFGFGDEIAAGMGSLFGLGPKLGGKSYDQILSEVRGKEKQFEGRHPVLAPVAEVAGALPTMLGAGAAVKAVPYVGRAAGVLDQGISKLPGWATRSAARGAAVGAPYGAITQVGKGENMSLGDYGAALGEGAKTGAMFGAAASPAFEGLGRAAASVIGPWATKEAQALIDKGVPLTAGETVGGVAKWGEDIMSRLPFAGSVVRGAQRRSIEGLNRAAIDEALTPIGQTIAKNTPVGYEALREASAKIGSSFDDVLSKTNGFVDEPLRAEISRIRSLVPQIKKAEFDDAVDRNIFQVAENGNLSGNAFKQAESALSQEASGLLKSQVSTPYDKMLGKHLYQAREAILDMAGRHNPPEITKQLRDTNEAFSRLLRVEKAGSSVAASDGVFTPAMLHNAVKATDKSARKGSFARGTAKLQDLSTSAKNVMTSTVPNSGTPERLGAMHMLEGLMHSGAYTGAGLGGLAPLATISGLYTVPVQSAFRYLASANPKTRQTVADIIRKYSTENAPQAAALYATN